MGSTKAFYQVCSVGLSLPHYEMEIIATWQDGWDKERIHNCSMSQRPIIGPFDPRPSNSRFLCSGGPAAGTTSPRATEIPT